MDLASGAREVYVLMTLFAKDGAPKLVPTCTYPLTGLGCVTRVHTAHAVFAFDQGRVQVVESYGIDFTELSQRLAVALLQ